MDPYWNPSNMIYSSESSEMPSVSSVMQSSNLYGYVMGNPVRFIDPLGWVVTAADVEIMSVDDQKKLWAYTVMYDYFKNKKNESGKQSMAWQASELRRTQEQRYTNKGISIACHPEFESVKTDFVKIEVLDERSLFKHGGKPTQDQEFIYTFMSMCAPSGVGLIEVAIEVDAEMRKDYEFQQRKNLKAGDVYIYYDRAQNGLGTNYFVRVDSNEPYVYLVVSNEKYRALLDGWS